MPFEIIRADITTLKVDAIVNAANVSLLGGGGVDGAIHKAAGPALLNACKALGGCDVGQSKITKGYALPSKYVIHTVGPVWKGGNAGESELLLSCYESALNLAQENEIESIAFPLIATGAYGYPKDLAMAIAQSAIKSFLMNSDMMIYLVVFDKDAFKLSQSFHASVKAYIDDHFVEAHKDTRNRIQLAQEDVDSKADFENAKLYVVDDALIDESSEIEAKDFDYDLPKSIKRPRKKRSLEDVLHQLEDTFSERLLRWIDEKNKTDVEIYKRANVDRKHFSKIRGDKYYKPSKSTAIAFAIALELNRDETDDLLLTAGYALSSSNKFDLIIKYFIENQIYDLYTINETLFAFDQPLLA
ncbi:O-acetyl-ADP-ribose deacetylase [Fusibacter bizertensis]